MARVRQSEAARQMGVNRSTVCRWVRENPALLDDQGLVDVAELRAFEATVKHPGNQTKPRAAGSVAPPDQESLPDPGPAPSGAPSSASGALNENRARRENAVAIGAELDLAERLRLTLRREDVERAVADAGDLIRQRASKLARDKAEILARIDDPRAMERALDEMMRELLAVTAAALAKAAQDEAPADAA